MAFRIFLAVIVVAASFISYGIFNLLSARAALKNMPPEFAYGPPDADLTVVEFLDYSCSHCRTIHPIIMEAIQRDGKINYIPRPSSHLNSESFLATKLVYAAAKQGKYKEAHQNIMENYRAMTYADIDSFAAQIGVDSARLKADSNNAETFELNTKSGTMALNLGVRSFPAFLIGPDIRFVPLENEIPSAADFMTLFVQVRAAQGR